ncbi:MAG: DNA cytosine methyltransferase [Paludibacteraceae bacterium]|nr:DNA cytosine methyltransferase [Bacteroidales bacterium]MDY4149925.1 DNA cytosine methyltransferase [Paludibacteraceae bacterium]
MAYKVIDLFAGVGGLSYGFAHDDDFEIIAANEILFPMAKAYSENHPKVKMYNKDIRDFSIDDLTRDLGICKGDVDVVVGGPPCQAYSTVGKRLIDDPRGKLFQEYYRMLTELRPKVFVFENVKGLLSMCGGELIHTILNLFGSLGYDMNIRLLNAADYGTPQIRERVILVGTLLGGKFEYPRPTHYDPNVGVIPGLKPYLTVGEAIGDLPVVSNGGAAYEYACEPQNDYQRLMRTHAPKQIMDQNVSQNGEHLVRLMEALPDGGSPEDIPVELRPKSGFKNCYCRLWWNRPSTTITRNLGCVSSSRCVHPKQPRPLTTREGARLQGFPDDYIFYGTRSEKNLQIGNAVPTFLSCAIKDSVKAYLDKNDHGTIINEEQIRQMIAAREQRQKQQELTLF